MTAIPSVPTTGAAPAPLVGRAAADAGPPSRDFAALVSTLLDDRGASTDATHAGRSGRSGDGQARNAGDEPADPTGTASAPAPDPTAQAGTMSAPNPSTLDVRSTAGRSLHFAGGADAGTWSGSPQVERPAGLGLLSAADLVVDGASAAVGAAAVGAALGSGAVGAVGGAALGAGSALGGPAPILPTAAGTATAGTTTAGTTGSAALAAQAVSGAMGTGSAEAAGAAPASTAPASTAPAGTAPASTAPAGAGPAGAGPAGTVPAGTVPAGAGPAGGAGGAGSGAPASAVADTPAGVTGSPHAEPRGATDPTALPASTSPPAPDTSTLGLQGPAAASTPAPTPTAATSAPAQGPAVTQQVLPHVTGLMTRGDGTHRIRLRLSPESLGDVSVVLTVRNGAVEVTLGAGAQARQALEQASAELHRLLELSGARSSQVVVKDLSGSSTPSPTTGQGDPGHGGSHAGGRPDDPGPGFGRAAPGTAARGSAGPGSAGPIASTAEGTRRSAHHPTSLDVTI